ncbi:MAG: hypothetical protein C3F11_09500 [Methylocystaceae bacterium]|nr:MAG: hypothetical protein C3F11_09500 [Methylocystaceae bacterium]
MSSLSFPVLLWLFIAAMALHNLEESIYLPSWPGFGLGGRLRISAFAFGFAANTLTVLAVVCAALAQSGGAGGLGMYLVCGFALAMVLNVVFPHLLQTLWTRSYAPGVGTAALLNLPTGTLLLAKAFDARLIDPQRFLTTGPLTIAAIVALIPLLFRIGDALETAIGGTSCRSHAHIPNSLSRHTNPDEFQ